MTALAHPSSAVLAAFLNGRLVEAERAQVEEHVIVCDSCCGLLKALPVDALAARLRDGDTSDLIGETLGPGGGAHTTFTAGIPPELADHPRYRIVEQLGAGGMGAVYLAEHRLMERRVAIKVIHPQFLNNSQAVERFEQEVKAAARLAHRNIVTAYDAEQAGGLHLLVMEYVPGINLATLVDRRGRLPVLHACNYAMQAAVGLQHAHQHGMVHRDIKPQNLMRTPRGTIKILDFGLARLARSPSAADEDGLTSAGCAMGTPDYIAPEQARDSRRADIRSDIYSLGCTLYFLLTGRVPFPGGTGLEKVVAHLQQTPLAVTRQRDDIPAGVVKVLQRMMAKEPSERFQEPSEVVEALRPFALPADQAGETRDSGGMTMPIAPLPVSDPLNDPLLALAAATSSPIKPRQPPVPQWQRMLHEQRVILMISGGALAALLLAIFILPQVMRGLTTAANPSPSQSDPVNLEPTLPNQANAAVANQSATPTDEWTDLIPRVDPVANAVAGDWHKVNSELRVYPAVNAKIVIPVQPPPEYDLEMEFTRHRGTQSIPLYFVAGGRQATFEIDAWDAGLGGIQNVDRMDLRSENNPTRVTNQRITNGRRTTMLVSVRRDRVEGYVDGRLITTYRGDGSDLSMLGVWDLQRPQVLGVGSYLSETTFHRIRMRPR
jgi:serine/threonine protein kinase